MSDIDLGEHVFSDEPAKDTRLLDLGMSNDTKGEFLLTRDMLLESDLSPGVAFRLISIELARRSALSGTQCFLRTEEFPNGDILVSWQTERFYDAPVSPELPDTFRR